MKYKTSELSGELLDEAVVIALGYMRTSLIVNGEKQSGCRVLIDKDDQTIKNQGRYVNGESFGAWQRTFSPSSDWTEGGPIIEREKIAVYFSEYRVRKWHALVDGRPDIEGTLSSISSSNEEVYGSTALEAAMRAFVQSKLGDEVNL